MVSLLRSSMVVLLLVLTVLVALLTLLGFGCARLDDDDDDIPPSFPAPTAGGGPDVRVAACAIGADDTLDCGLELDMDCSGLGSAMTGGCDCWLVSAPVVRFRRFNRSAAISKACSAVLRFLVAGMCRPGCGVSRKTHSLARGKLDGLLGDSGGVDWVWRCLSRSEERQRALSS